MSSWLAGFFARKAATKVAEIVGVDRNDSNIIKLPWWYSLCHGFSTLFFGFLLLVPFFVPEAEVLGNQKSMTLFIIINIVFWFFMIILFFHFLLYKIVIEKDHIRFRRIFFYRKYYYKNIYIYGSGSHSYYFLYYGKRYLTRLSYQLDNVETLFDFYRNYFMTTGIIEPQGPQGYIKQSRIWLLCALIFQALAILMMGVSYVAFEEGFYYMFLLEIPVLLLLLYYLVWSVKFDKQELIYRNFIGIKRRYPIKSLSYQMTNGGYWIKKGGKRICYLWMILNSDELLKKIKNEDRKVYKKK